MNSETWDYVKAMAVEADVLLTCDQCGEAHIATEDEEEIEFLVSSVAEARDKGEHCLSGMTDVDAYVRAVVRDEDTECSLDPGPVKDD